MKMENNTYDAGSELQSIVGYVKLRGLRDENGVAYTFLNDPEDKASYQRITYGALLRRVVRLAGELSRMAKAGDRVILLYPPGIEYIVAFYGCLWAGLVAVPAYPIKNNQHRERLGAIIRDCDASIILAQAADIAKLQEIRESTFSKVGEHYIFSEPTSPDRNEIDLCTAHPVRSDLAFLQYTSGSTGDPKGVMVTHSNLLHNLSEIRDKFGNTRHTVMVSWLPPYHDMGLISAILEPLFVGFQVVLMSPFSFIQRPMRWLKAISEFKATVSGGPNFAFDLALNACDIDPASLSLGSLRIMYSGAEPIQLTTLSRFCDRFSVAGFTPEMLYPCYGLAEGTLFSSGGDALARPSLLDSAAKRLVAWDSIHTVDHRWRVGCGRTLGQQEIRIVDPNCQCEVSDGQEGEIWLKGPSVAKGYWGREGQSLETFNAFTVSGTGPFMRTGDLGFLVKEELFVTGRMKDTIIVRGKKYYPQDIERAVEEEVVFLRPSCTIAINVGDDGDIGVVAEIERTARKTDPSALLADIRRAVGRSSGLSPATVAIVAPGRTLKTSSGKVQRRMTRKLLEQQEMEVWARWDRSPSEVRVAGIDGLAVEG